MSILCIRTDKPEAELYLYAQDRMLAELKWEADRKLSLTLHRNINKIFKLANRSKKELKGIVIYEGPGSFTGLRIGFSVANSMAYTLQVPVIESGGKKWTIDGVTTIISGKGKKIALPQYGKPANTTLPKNKSAGSLVTTNIDQ